MDKEIFSDMWEKLPNDLFVSKLRTFVGVPRVSIEAMKTIGEKGVKQIDGYFKDRRKIKNFSQVVNRGTREHYFTQADSEIFVHKKGGYEIYCYNDIILPVQKYVNPKEIEHKRSPGYTIMLLTEIISTDVREVLLSNKMNDALGHLSGKLRVERIQSRRNQ